MVIETFHQYEEALVGLLDLPMEEKIQSNITLKDFFDTCAEHEGWQNPVMNAIDTIMYEKLFKNVSGDTVDLNKEELDCTKEGVLDYIRDFTEGALQAGYSFIA